MPFSAVREHAVGATSKKMILGGVPGVILGLAQKRSVSAFLLIFSTLWFPLVSLWLYRDPAVTEASAAPEVSHIVLPSSVSFS